MSKLSYSVSKQTYYKTKMCPWYSRNRCMRKEDCLFAHSQEELREVPNLAKTSLCPNIKKYDVCNVECCKFAHTLNELRCTDDVYKTSFCFRFPKGYCSAGQNCRHAHGEYELRGGKKIDWKQKKNSRQTKSSGSNGLSQKFNELSDNAGSTHEIPSYESNIFSMDEMKQRKKRSFKSSTSIGGSSELSSLLCNEAIEEQQTEASRSHEDTVLDCTSSEVSDPKMAEFAALFSSLWTAPSIMDDRDVATTSTATFKESYSSEDQLGDFLSTAFASTNSYDPVQGESGDKSYGSLCRYFSNSLYPSSPLRRLQSSPNLTVNPFNFIEDTSGELLRNTSIERSNELQFKPPVEGLRYNKSFSSLFTPPTLSSSIECDPFYPVNRNHISRCVQEGGLHESMESHRRKANDVYRKERVHVTDVQEYSPMLLVDEFL